MGIVRKMIAYISYPNHRLFESTDSVSEKSLMLACSSLLEWASRYCHQENDWVLMVSKTATSYAGTKVLLQDPELAQILRVVETEHTLHIGFESELKPSERAAFIAQICQQPRLPFFPKELQ